MIVVIISVIGIIYAFTQKPVRTPTNDLVRSQSEANIIEYPGQDGQTALELLQAQRQVEAKNYSFGDLVMSIDGVAADSQHFWAMYVNGQFSQVGASAYVTKNSDMIKWQIDEIKN